MSRRLPPAPATTQAFVVDRLGADGDGIAAYAGGVAYLPWTLPGERVRAAVSPGSAGVARGGIPEILAPSPERVAPPCPHFGDCGGCVLQHWAPDAALAWKAGLVTAALARAGFPEAVPRVVPVPPGARRRMDLALARTAGAVSVGLHARHGQRVVDWRTCLVLDPALTSVALALRPMLSGLSALRRAGSAVANRVDTGIDLLLRLDGEPSLADRQRLLAFARAHDLPRLSVALADGPPETVGQFRPPTIRLGAATVQPAPGAFLQASPAGEAAIVAAVVAGLPQGLPRRAWIADLYAGCGTLTFPLAEHGAVRAFEGDAAAATALRQAANAAGRPGRVTVAQRDLARQRMRVAEFAGCAVAVLDPPHAGAGAQADQVAATGIPRVVMVSCNPQALGRDAALLRAAGYRLLEVTVIDQFPWSARVESVSVFAR